MRPLRSAAGAAPQHRSSLCRPAVAARHTVTALVACSALVLAACTGGDRSAAPPRGATPVAATPTAHASPSMSPTASGTDSPVPLDDDDASWATVERFFAAYTLGIQTGDSSSLTSLTGPSCESCANLIADIDQLKARGLSGIGGAFDLSDHAESPSAHENRVVWEVRYRHAPVTYTSRESHSPTTVPGEEASVLVEVTKDRGTWLISGIAHSAEDAS